MSFTTIAATTLGLADGDQNPTPVSGTVRITPRHPAGAIDSGGVIATGPVVVTITGGAFPSTAVPAREDSTALVEFHLYTADGPVRMPATEVPLTSGETINLRDYLPAAVDPATGQALARGERGPGITDITADSGVVTVEWDGGADVEIPIPTAALATPTSDGLMPAADKVKLDGLTPYYRATLTAASDVSSIRGSHGVAGKYAVESTSTPGLPPLATHGTLEVDYASASGRTIQTFHAIRAGAQAVWRRVHSGGTWSEWSSLTWRQLAPNSAFDFDSVRDTGVISIQRTNHPNQPVASVGTLETLPASGELLQRFTTWEAEPRTFTRRSISSTAWGSWQEGDPGVSEIRERLLATAPTRAPITAPPATSESRVGSHIMTSLSRDRTHGWNCYTHELRRTWDDGKTWEPVVSGSNPFAGSTIESVMQLDNDELLVTNVIGSESRRAVWVSEGYGTGSPTFTRTLTAHARYVKFTSAWSQSAHGRIVLINDYGPKSPEWAGEAISAEDTARYTHLSMDYGKTWRTVFDLHDYLINDQGRESTDSQHLHGVAWDPYWDRIWVSFGDSMGGLGSNGVVYSDDLGDTWNTAHFWGGGGSPHQVVGILPLPGCVLFAGDMGPHMVRIDRSPGKHSGPYVMETAWESSAPGKHLCQAIHKPRWGGGGDSPALFAFSSEGQDAPSIVVATRDGFTFTEIWRDSELNPPGMGARNIVGPTVRGNVIMASNDRKVDGMWSEIVMREVGY